VSVKQLPVEPIDFHTHVGRVLSFNPRIKGWVESSLGDLLSYMNEAGIERAVVLSIPPRADPYASFLSNSQLLREVQPHQGRLIAFCCPSPLRRDAVSALKKLVEAGCRGLGEVKVGLRVDDPRLLKLLRAAESLGLPALIHVEEGPYFHYCHGAEALAEVLKGLPDLKLVVHGPGWWSRISAEGAEDLYPSGPVRGEGLVHELLRRFDNLYADISANSGLNALRRDPEHALRFIEEFQEKLIFGTDFPCLSDSGQFGPDRSHLDFLLKLCLPNRALRRILRQNAERLLEKRV